MGYLSRRGTTVGASRRDRVDVGRRRLMGGGYSQAAAQNAQRRILDFFGLHLAGGHSSGVLADADAMR
jgi:hypothetical protein